MPEEHVLTTTSGATAIERQAKLMFDAWTQITASAVAKFSLDGATVAVNDGTVYGTPSDQTFFENDGAFFVFEFVTLPLLDCQYKVTLDSVAADILVEYAPSGGFVALAFPGNTSGDLAFLDTAPGATDQIYMSIADLDGYPYLRMLHWDGVGFNNGFRAGGYVAADPENTKPHCLLLGIPAMGDGTGLDSWGHITGALNRIPNEYVGDGGYPSPIAAAGFASCHSVEQMTQNTFGLTLKGRAVIPPVFLGRVGNFNYGKFGNLDMFGIDDAKADRDTDGGTTFLVCNDLFVRFNP